MNNVVAIRIRNPQGVKNTVAIGMGCVIEEIKENWVLVATVKHVMQQFENSQGMTITDIEGTSYPALIPLLDPNEETDIAFIPICIKLNPEFLRPVIWEYRPDHGLNQLVTFHQDYGDILAEKRENVARTSFVIYKKMGDDNIIFASHEEHEQGQITNSGYLPYTGYRVALGRGYSGAPLINSKQHCLGIIQGGITHHEDNGLVIKTYGDATWVIAPQDIIDARERIGLRLNSHLGR